MFKFLVLTFFIVSSAISASAVPFSPATNDTVLATRTPGVSTLEADMSSLVDRSKEFEGAVANLSPGKLIDSVQMHAVQNQAAALTQALETTKQNIKVAGVLSETDNLALRKGFMDMKPHLVSAMKLMQQFAHGEALEELREATAQIEGLDMLDGSAVPNPVELITLAFTIAGAVFGNILGSILGGSLPFP